MSVPSHDEEQLRLISIFHYVWGGLLAFGLCFVMLGMLIGLGLLAGSSAHNGPPPWVGAFILFGATIALLFGGAKAALTFYAGHSLANRRHHTFCVIVAALDCLSFPFGTALGVFTLIVLSRPSVRALFIDTSARPATG